MIKTLIVSTILVMIFFAVGASVVPTSITFFDNFTKGIGAVATQVGDTTTPTLWSSMTGWFLLILVASVVSLAISIAFAIFAVKGYKKFKAYRSGRRY